MLADYNIYNWLTTTTDHYLARWHRLKRILDLKKALEKVKKNHTLH